MWRALSLFVPKGSTPLDRRRKPERGWAARGLRGERTPQRSGTLRGANTDVRSAALVALLMTVAGGCPATGASADAPQPAASASTPGTASQPADVHFPEEKDAPAAPFQEPYFPFFDDEPSDRSVSVGTSSHGFVVHARAVEESEALGVLSRQRARDLGYGTTEMVALLEHAAHSFHAAHGRRMWIGNVGRRGGGDIAFSVSHNSGRDADVAFCYTDLRGKPVDPPDLVPLNDEGVNHQQALRFDAERTWTIVRALVTDGAADVQYLFVSSALKRKLLLFAKTSGERAAVVERAAAVLWPQVGHNDHLHVRIYCGERDVEGGCRNEGVIHPWAHEHREALARRVADAVERLAAASSDTRRRAVERLALCDARGRATLVAERLEDDAEDVRGAAARALAALGGAEELSLLTGRYERETTATVRSAIVHAVASIGGPSAGTFFRDAIVMASPLSLRVTGPMFGLVAGLPGAAPLGAGAWLTLLLPELPPLDGLVGDPQREVWLAAIDAAGSCERLEPVASLLPLLDLDDTEGRHHATAALARLVNRDFGGEGAADEVARERAARQMRAWVAAHVGEPRARWLASGFSALGYRVPALQQRHLWELVRAASGPGHVSYNAQRVLARLTKRDAEILGSQTACHDWLRWLSARRKELKLSPAPKRLLAACR